LLFGAETDKKVRLPFGSSAALKIARWLDPSLTADIQGERPWIYSPFLCAMNALSVYTRDAPQVNDLHPTPGTLVAGRKGSTSSHSLGNFLHRSSRKGGRSDSPAHSPAHSPHLPPASPDVGTPTTLAHHPSHDEVGTWSWHSTRVPEQVSLLFADAPLDLASPTLASAGPTSPTPTPASPNLASPQEDAASAHGSPSIKAGTTLSRAQRNVAPPSPFTHPHLHTYERRKRYFADPKHRAPIRLRAGHIYCFDYFDAYLDPVHLSLKLPGYSMSLFSHWDNHRFYYVCKDRSGAVYFVICFEWKLKEEVEAGVAGNREAS
jgi:hypothetical protein